MAEKQLLLNKGAEDDFLAEDDPLAELARIVGFEPRPEASGSKAANRREPEFDLEDELLKEFETYESEAGSEEEPVPSHVETDDRHLPSDPVAEPQFLTQPGFEDADRAEESDTLAEAGEEALLRPFEPDVSADDSDAHLPEEAPSAATGPDNDAFFDLEDEMMREFEAFDARRSPARREAQPDHVIRVVEPEPAVEPVQDADLDAFADEEALTDEEEVEASAPVQDVLSPADDVADVEDHPTVAHEAENENSDQSQQAGEPADPHDLPMDLSTDDLLADEVLASLAEPEVESEPTRSDWMSLRPIIDDQRHEAVDAEPVEEVEETFARTPEEDDLGEETVDEPVSEAVVDPDLDLSADTVHFTPEEPLTAEEPEEPLATEEDLFEDRVSDAPETADIRVLPVDNEAQQDQPVDALEQGFETDLVDEVEPEIDLDFDLLDEDDAIEEMVLPEAPADTIDVAPEEPAPVQERAEVEAPAPVADDFGLDELLADVARFPVPPAGNGYRSRATPTVSPPIIPLNPPPREEIVREEPPTVRATTNAPIAAPAPVSEPAPTINVVTERAAVQPERLEPVSVVAPPAEKPATAEKTEAADPDPFDDGAFDLDLGELELDLAELSLDEEPVAPAVEAAPEATRTASADMLNAIAAATVVPAARADDKSAAANDYSALPFDPSQIISEEEKVEAVRDLDVPELPGHHEPEPASDLPEYDLDVDLGMDDLLGAAEPTPVAARDATPSGQPEKGTEAWFMKTDATGSKVTMDLDEFERALEADFKRDLGEEGAPVAPQKRSISSDFETGVVPNRSRRWLAMAASTAVLLLIGGAAVYAWLSGDVGPGTTDGPRIILADKEPTKIVPENKGGRTVPNQDKAVYDRVAGQTQTKPSQESLVSTTEDPIDPVQRTLLPETLPMDEEMPGTATDDTADPRLLPDDAGDNVSTANKAVTGVAPRKVRTMIVRADGTLVPRDETNELEEAAAGTKAARVLAPGVADDAQAETETEVADPVADTTPTPTAEKPAEAAQVPDEQITDAEIKDEVTPPDATSTEVPADNALADVANATVEETAPVREVTTTKVTAPVPESRPVDQPVNVVGRVNDRGEVTDTQASQLAEAKPVAQPEVQPQATNAAVPPGSYVIQIASLPSEAEAQTSYNRLSSRFAGVIGGRGVDIKRAEIKGKGTYYRVRIPAGTRAEANALCERYKSAGGSCLVSR